MIDFIKIKVTDAKVIQHFWQHHLLYMHSNSEKLLYDNEVIKEVQKKQYKNVIFEFTHYALYIHFKPHYYYNNNLHNANDFSVLDCINTLIEFTKNFNVNLKCLQIINIEFGFNVVIPKELKCVKELLIYMIYHCRNPFYTNNKYLHCRFSHSIDRHGKANVYKMIKAYSKGVQYPMFTDENTFRFEVKSNRKEYINRLGIYTLHDLLNPNIYNILTQTLLKEFDDVLIIDDEAKPNLSGTKLNNHYKKLNPIYWCKLLNKSQNAFRRNLKAYNDALNTCDTHLKKDVRKLIFDKLLDLKMCAYLTIYKDKTSTLLIPEELCKKNSLSCQL